MTDTVLLICLIITQVVWGSVSFYQAHIIRLQKQVIEDLIYGNKRLMGDTKDYL